MCLSSSSAVYEKVLVLQVPSKSLTSVVEKALVFNAKRSEMYEQIIVLHVSIKSLSIFIEITCVLKTK